MSAHTERLVADLPAILLRVSLAFVFSFAAISSLISPDDWVGYLPKIATKFVDGHALLLVLSIYQLGLSAWLLTGWKVRYAAGLSALTLAGITASNLGLLAISFRDIGLTIAAAALAFLPTKDVHPGAK